MVGALEEFELRGRTAVVIGASRGLGRRMALALAEAGANLMVASRSRAPLEELAGQIRALGREAFAAECDIARVGDCERLLREAVGRFGKVDVLVNAAGTILRKPSQEVTEEEWDRLMAVNLKGMFFACQVFGAHMIARGGGKIINIASLASELALPGRALYGISKAGVLALTKALALEWARYKINVNAIGPGYFETELTAPLLADEDWRRRLLRKIPLGRVGRPEDLDGITVFLASPASNYVTGQIFYIDGGFLAGELEL